MAEGIRLWMFICLTLLAKTITGENPDQGACPRFCECEGTSVQCKDKGLTEIPSEIASSTTILDLSYNKLKAVDTEKLKHLLVLQELRLQWNEIEVVPDLSKLPTSLTKLLLQHNKISSIFFGNLTKPLSLSTLDLNYNQIERIQDGTFPNGSSLKTLILSNNKLSVIEDNALRNLVALETLKLNRNQLSKISVKSFNNMHSLKYLEMNRNNLKEIPSLAFRGLKSLRVLKLSRNKLQTLQAGCFVDLEVETLYLDFNNLSIVGDGWLFGLAKLQQLYLRNNQIKDIHDDVWKWCPLLTILDLARNNLEHIAEKSMSKLNKLQRLYLSENHIYHISRHAFSDLGSLEILDLNHNDISWTVENMRDGFAGLTVLKSLYLAGNRITLIASGAFTGLENLEVLDLSNNIITSLKDNAFSQMLKLKALYLNSSHLLCDCRLKWFPSYIRRRGFGQSVQAKCLHPVRLRGVRIANVSASEMKCDSAGPLPDITIQPRNLTSTRGDNVTFSCTAINSSIDDMKVVWKRDYIVLSGAHVVNYAQTTDGNLVMYTSNLKLYNIDNKDDGQYQCIITNKYGSAYSKKAKLRVLVFPRFTRRPDNVVVRTGETAQLVCRSDGHPLPDIRWQKDGGKDFPAGKERRMKLISDDVFIIQNVKPADMGYYSCIASNEAGKINETIRLTVLETPKFVSTIPSRIREVGDSVLFVCHATGSPPPKHTWYKDGQRIDTSGKHYTISTNKEMLIIPKVRKEDAGDYACEITNTVGTALQVATLTVDNDGTGVTGKSKSTYRGKATFLDIIILTVVCCVVGTSLIWALIVICLRKSNNERQTFNNAIIEKQDVMIDWGDEACEHKPFSSSEEDVKYVTLKPAGSSGSESLNSGTESPRSTTATYLTGEESQSQSLSTFANGHSSGSETNSNILKMGQLSSATNSNRGSCNSLSSGVPSDSSVRSQQIVTKAQIHTSDSDSDRSSRRKHNRHVSPSRRKASHNRGHRTAEDLAQYHELTRLPEQAVTEEALDSLSDYHRRRPRSRHDRTDEQLAKHHELARLPEYADHVLDSSRQEHSEHHKRKPRTKHEKPAVDLHAEARTSLYDADSSSDCSVSVKGVETKYSMSAGNDSQEDVHTTSIV